MKKITLIVFMFLMSWCGYSQLALEDFEGNGTAFPADWQQINVGDPGVVWVIAAHNAIQTPAFGDAGHVAFLNRQNVATGTTEDWLVTPQFNAPPNGQLRFMSRLTQLGDDQSTYRIMIHIGNDPTNTAAYTQVQAWTELTLNPPPNETAYVEKVVTLPPASANQMVHLAFVMNGDFGDRWLVDNVRVVAQCLDPVGQTTTNIGTNTATLNWTNPSNTNQWTIDIVSATGAPTGGGLSYSGLPPYVATTDSAGNPLQPATQYKYYVTGICSDGGTSNVAGPYYFTTVVPGTNCSAPIVIPTNTYSHTSNTNLYGDDIEGTPGATGCNAGNNFLNGDEVVYAYTPTYTGNAGFSMTNNGANSGMFIYTSCANIGVACADGGTGNATTPVNIASFPVTAGTTYYIVISTSTTQSTPYTLTVQQVNCAPPVGLPTMGVDADSANLSWTNPSGASSWEIVVQAANSGIPAGAGTTVTVNTNYVAGPLADGTAYEYYVRAACGDGTFSAWAGPYTFTTTQVPVSIINYVQNFEGTHGFALANGSQTNKWVVGTATSNSPTHSLYISNDNGVSNNYTDNAASVVHAFRDLQMPATVDQFTLSFDWKSGGEGTPPGTVWDYFKVWVVPATFTPTPGTLIAAAPDRIQLGGLFNLNPAWTTANYTVNAAPYAGTVMRLIFEWRNDTSAGTMPGAAIDNININLVSCPSPTNVALGTPFTNNSAVVNWTGPTTVTPTFDYVFGTTNTAPTAGTTPTGNVSAATVPFTGLTPSTTYYFWVRSNCGGGTTSPWVGPFSFTTPQIPAIPNFTQDFETPGHQWTLSNGTQTNQWVYGTAVSNSPTHSLYISNTNGTTHNYSTSSSSVVHAYRDIQLPTPLDQVALQYDWRNQGENGWDYIRVWVVPVTHVPTPGTQITAANSGGFQLGGDHQASNTWATATHIINAGSYAGQVVRLVFEWRNDGGGGSQQPGAIDNVNVQIVTCPSPTALVVGAVSQTTAAISWTGPTSVTPTYDYYYNTTNTAPTASTTPTGNVTPENVGLTGLTPSTNYYFWVRSNCGTTDGNSIWIGPVSFITPQNPADLDYSMDFEIPGHEWTLSNGMQTNKWVYGTAVSSSPTHSLYVSNTNGTTHNYDISASSVVHAYRDIALPTPLDQVSLQYDWRNQGENGWDYIRVWVVPVTHNPVPGTQITAANSGGFQLGGNHQGSNTWANATHIINAADYAGQTVRLVFEWRNDGGGGTQQPGAIDNINIQVVTCPSPTALTLGAVTQNSAAISWTGPTSVTPTFDYYYATTNTAPTASTVPTGNVTPENVDLTGLTPSTAYYFWVRSNCGDANGNSIWIGPLPFVTTQIPAEIEYTQDFEDTDHGWALSNGTQTNKWVYGTAVSNSPTHSLYISNDNGTTHNYVTNSSSVVHAYRDVLVEDEVNMINVSFDWRNQGENNWDYIRVWVVPTTFVPTPGTQITAANSGGIQLGGNHQLSNAWTTSSYNVATPGPQSIRRIVFEWRNDSGGGAQQPGAIDNINIQIVTCPPPYDVNVSCVSSSGVNVAWEPGGSETSWEYAILPVGSAVPTSGTVTEETAFAVETLTNNTEYTVYVRAICSNPDEMSSWAQANFETTDVSIIEAEPFCASTETNGGIIFDNTFGQGAGSGYGQVACLGSTPNPVWYYLQIEDDGPIDFQLVQNTQFDNAGVPIGTGLDVDFAAFGPFTSLTEACAQVELIDCPTCPNNTANPNFYPFGNIVDCSFDGAFIENFTIPNAVEGQIYAVLITNFNGAQGQIQLQQLETSEGSTNCNILYDVALGDDKVLCGVPNTTITATVTTPGNSQAPTYEWFMDDSPSPFTPTIISTTSLTQTIQVSEPGEHTYTVVVTVPNASNSEPITDTVMVTLAPDVVIPDPAEVVLCGFDGETSIDLTTLNDDVLGALPAADYVVSYYETEAEADDEENAIDLTVPYETDTVTIWVRIQSATFECFDIVPLTITVNDGPGATIAYANSPYCTSAATATVTHTGSPGGVYTADAGVAINAATGEITLATTPAGTYTVTYTVEATALCPEFETTAQIVIEAAPEATIAYAGPYCVGTGTATVTQTGTTGGAYSSTGGLSIDAVTGEIDLTASTSGTYTVTYTIAATTACAELQVTAQVELADQFTATIDYGTAPFCSNAGNATVIVTGNTGGTFTSTDGLVIDPVTGTVDLAASTAGTYTVTYTLAETLSCPEFTATADIVIEAAPDAAIAYAATPYCANAGTATVTLTGTAGGAYSGDAGLVIDPVTGDIDLAASTLGTHTITYTIAATAVCGPLSVTAEIVINALPVATIAYPGSPYCSDAGTATVTFAGDAGGTYAAEAGLAINAVTGDIDLAASTAGTYNVTYTIAAANGCPDVVATASVTVTKLPSAVFTYEVAALCQNAGGTESPTFETGAAAGIFTVDIAGLSIDAATGAINPAASTEGTYIVTNTIAAANGCGLVAHSVTIVINPAPIADFSYDALEYCQNSGNPSPILQGGAGTFSGSAGLVIDAVTGVINLEASTPGTHTVTNTIPGTPDCPSVSASVQVTVTSIPVVAVLQGCEGQSYMLEATFDMDDIYTVDTVDFVWTNSAGTVIGSSEKVEVATPGTYHLVVIPQANGECMLELDVPVTDTACDVPRGISPNNDNLNDRFDLTVLDVKKLGIFNRYGQEVYSYGNGYTNQWEGQSSGGDELPTGTYFYMIERNNGETKTGWVYVNREE
ncbi:fibronectin type III domain-containing protein [uncultured Flavobacterium sp.]|uniref:fibronectin type III domain-containing protein n=1 Tax=uncultured Flavobacterium sp. TaxID=165435 RepID=UPI0025D1ED78|nr:fibronectin type III domain-containing protein [uncultured Flavobacterium sp.]